MTAVDSTASWSLFVYLELSPLHDAHQKSTHAFISVIFFVIILVMEKASGVGLE